MTGPFIQIVNINNNHWICFSSIHSPPGYVNVYDSLSTPVNQQIIRLAYDLTGPAFQKIRCIPVQQQKNLSDCGVFSIAFATSLVYGQNPMNVTYNINQMRLHLMQCLKGGNITPFPTTWTSFVKHSSHESLEENDLRQKKWHNVWWQIVSIW